jgi:ZIP family zinc transporter
VNKHLPESQRGEKTDIATVGATVGFAVMMLLDVALG